MRLRVMFTLGLVAAATLMIQPVAAQNDFRLPIRMRAFAVNMTNVLTGANGIFEIRVTNWSTAAQRERLITTMAEKGQNALLSAMRKESIKGRIRIPGWQGPDPQNYRLGWDLRYAWHDSLPEGGERIVIGTDRYMSMWEIRNQPRTVDYPFTFIELHMPREGKGEGRMTAATQLQFDKKTKTISLEQYSAGTLHLNEITIEKD
jgi:hypothetical protein